MDGTQKMTFTESRRCKGQMQGKGGNSSQSPNQETVRSVVPSNCQYRRLTGSGFLVLMGKVGGGLHNSGQIIVWKSE